MRDIDSLPGGTDDPLVNAVSESGLTTGRQRPARKIAKGRRKNLARNRDFAAKAEEHEDLKELIENAVREIEKLGLKEEMLQQYPESRTIPVFKSPRGLLAQLIVAHIATRDEATLRRVLGPQEFRYPLVSKRYYWVLSPEILEKRIRQRRVPKKAKELLTTTRTTFDTYVPKPGGSRRLKSTRSK